METRKVIVHITTRDVHGQEHNYYGMTEVPVDQYPDPEVITTAFEKELLLDPAHERVILWRLVHRFTEWKLPEVSNG